MHYRGLLTVLDIFVRVVGKDSTAGDVSTTSPTPHEDCFAVRLLPGSPKELIHYPLEMNIFETTPESTDEELSDWFYTFFATEVNIFKRR